MDFDSKTRVLVTGGAGFIGSHIVHRLAELGVPVAVLDNLASGHRENVPDGVTLHEVDVRDAERVTATFDEFKPTVVCHQAAQASVKVSVEDPILDASVNILGGVNVLEACRVHHCQRVVFASTGGALYGEVPEGEVATEGWPIRPKSPYAVSKACFEQYLSSYAQNFGLKYTALRYANVYGPRQDPHGEAGVVAIFAERLLKAQPLVLYARKSPGDGGCIRDYVYVEDVRNANLRAIADIDSSLGRVLNVGTGVATTTQALLRVLEAATDTQVEVESLPPREGDLEVSVLSSQLLQETGWSAAVALDEGLRRTVAWYRSCTN